ncbi:Adenylate kinase 8 [Porphyridium purpureum]|uniref:Adenylate kinase 8 n=1 Tax=Porphyridium purpureum TaxID=35688 RepID=A0A5J4YRR5_PORPP|nr:Adenylate kinase 8 [Porphyridium purpureum]|eukprot:POR4728..scf229_5
MRVARRRELRSVEGQLGRRGCGVAWTSRVVDHDMAFVSSAGSAPAPLRSTRGVHLCCRRDIPQHTPVSLSSRPAALLGAARAGPLRGARHIGLKASAMETSVEESVSASQSLKRIMITGAPASGKGTQCVLIAAKYGVVHISTGDMLRAEVKAGSELGKAAKGFMDSGQLVPDDLIIGMLQSRLQQEDVLKQGWLLDGFPRTDAQAEALDQAGVQPDVVLQLDVDDKVLLERVVGRRTDPVTGAIYHLKFDPPPNDPQILDRLVHRSDDTEEKALVRLEQYYSHAATLLSRYSNVVQKVNGMQDKNAVFKEIEFAVDATFAPKSKPGDGKSTSRANSKPSLQMVIMGAPGSGKGTQCALLAEKYSFVHLSTGDMLRAAVKAQSELGKQAKEFMDRGALVPDSLVISLIKERMAQPDVQEQGWLLDGFPRTSAQADALEAAGIRPKVVATLSVPDDKIVARIVGRRTDPETGRIYHMVFDPPTDPEVAQRLVQRSDDVEEKVRARLDAYKEYNAVLESKYKSVLCSVNGDQGKNDVFSALCRQIEYQSGAKQRMSVNAFVEKAEEAFERGYLEAKNTNYSGQAGADLAIATGSSSYGDILNRPVLAAGDLSMFLVFASIGQMNHKESVDLLSTLQVAFPFALGWVLGSPVLGAYTAAATSSQSAVLACVARSALVALPLGLAIRGLETSHVPPPSFAGIAMITNLILLSAWRSAYISVAGTSDPGPEKRGGLLDGFKMITTLLRRCFYNPTESVPSLIALRHLLAHSYTQAFCTELRIGGVHNHPNALPPRSNEFMLRYAFIHDCQKRRLTKRG